MAETEEIVIDVELSEPQAAVLESRAALILQMAGQGSGKSLLIGLSSGQFVMDFPQLRGFIGANTADQLSHSTMSRVMACWRDVYGLMEYDPKMNPAGAYVIDRRPPPHFKRIHLFRKYEGVMSFWNGAAIYLGSLENYKAHDGKELGWAQLDETKDTKEEALKDVIIGRLRQYGLWYHRETKEIIFDDQISAEQAAQRELVSWNPLYIHTSPAMGGVKWLNDMFLLGSFDKQIKRQVMQKEQAFFNERFENKEVVIYSTHHNAHNLPPGYIDNQIASLNDEDKVLRLVYAYPFGKAGGEYFGKYSRDKHNKPVLFNEALPVHISFDFNVVPFMTAICLQLEYVNRFIDQAKFKYDEYAEGRQAIEVCRVKVYKEYCLENPHNTTEAVCEHFAADHDPGTTEIFYYGDATGLNRIPGLNKSNFKIISEELELYTHSDSKKVKQPNVAPLKRRDLLNDIFSGKYPEIEIEIDQDECPNLVDDLENVKMGAKGKVKKKVTNKKTGESYEEYGHTSDALECALSEIFKEFI